LLDGEHRYPRLPATEGLRRLGSSRAVSS
jgi:hypothetical protein